MRKSLGSTVSGWLLASALTAAGTMAYADGPAFDLAGPKVDVHIQRAGRTLPIANVPNLMGGDRLWIHPDLPPSQSAHLILIVAFLRGSTNPPPADWFREVKTWDPAVRSEGVFVTVPAEAQQALIFLAPETGGDFTTLRKAVQGRPGAFVRATQDLQLASWDRQRLDVYLAQMKLLTGSDPKTLKERAEMMARSLGLKVDQGCFDKPAEQQASCLTAHTDGLVLDDSNAQSVVTQMANGSAADLANQLSYSTRFGAGAFSPYVGAVIDVARILSSLHTAKYQYIPALTLPQADQPDTFNLKLNVPPSFRDPKSVIVVALPPIEPAKLPQMRPASTIENVDKDKDKLPSDLYCAAKPELTLAADGAPLVFSTGLAHELVLHIDTKAKQPSSGSEHTSSPGPSERTEISPKPSTAAPAKPETAGIDLAIRPDPTRGGFVVTTPLPTLPEAETTAEIRGEWGFDQWNGPKFHLVSARSGAWTLESADKNALIIGREDTVHLEGQSSLCVQEITAKVNQKDEKIAWKSPKPNQLELTLPLKDVKPGEVTLTVKQYGLSKHDELSLKAYAEAASLEHLKLSVGDKSAELKGKRLDEVQSAEFNGVQFSPAALHRVQDFDVLALGANGATTSLQPGESYTAKVTLRDGRTIDVPASVTGARPQVELTSKSVQKEDGSTEAAAKLAGTGNSDDLPLQRKLNFFLKSRVPSSFPRTEKVEIAAADGSFTTTLTLADHNADGGMLLEDAHTAVVTIDPQARFGSSAFGPIQLRAVGADGIAGDWVPLGTLVRLPAFPQANALKCPRNQTKPCQLSGNNLFLITSVGSTPDMGNAVDVPADMTYGTVQVPNIGKPSAPAFGSTAGPQGTVYVRLRDDPNTIQALSLPVTQFGSSEASKPSPATPAPQGNDAPDLTTTVPGNAASSAGSSPASAPSNGSASAAQPVAAPHR